MSTELKPAELPRDLAGQRYFGFCGAKVYIPDEPSGESISERVLRLFRQRLKEATDGK